MKWKKDTFLFISIQVVKIVYFNTSGQDYKKVHPQEDCSS